MWVLLMLPRFGGANHANGHDHRSRHCEVGIFKCTDAVTADGGDYTVHLVVGLDPDGRMYLLDRWRKQSSSDEWIEAFCNLLLEWKPMAWAEEKGQISAGVGPALDRRQRERKPSAIVSSSDQGR
jgi:hypothetical protein